MKTTGPHAKIAVSADGTGIVSQAGGVLLTQTLRATGLDRSLSAALERWRASRALHDPGKLVTDLAVAPALGGDCLADAAMLRAQPELFGPVASDPVVSRLVTRLAGDAPAVLKAIRGARVWPGVEDADNSGAGDANDREWQRPAGGCGGALWWVRCRWWSARCRCQSMTSLTAERAAASSTRFFPAAKAATRDCRARLLTARG